jgi:hypothetical protein
MYKPFTEEGGLAFCASNDDFAELLSGYLSPEQVRERERKLMKSIVKVLDDNVDFTKYVPHAIGYVVDKMADYDPNDEFWQALKEETEKG